MHPFSTTCKHQKNLRFSQGVEKGCIGNEWVKKFTPVGHKPKVWLTSKDFGETTFTPKILRDNHIF